MVFELWCTDFSSNQAPVWGAVRYVNKRFKHDDFFHGENETSPDLDAVWKNLTGREFPLGMVYETRVATC